MSSSNDSNRRVISNIVFLDKEKKCNTCDPNQSNFHLMKVIQSYFHLMKVTLIVTVSNPKMIFCNKT